MPKFDVNYFRGNNISHLRDLFTECCDIPGAYGTCLGKSCIDCWAERFTDKGVIAPHYGKWIRPKGSTRGSYQFQCSECGETVYYVHGCNNRNNKDIDPSCGYPSCPYCHAIMRKE